MKSIVIVASLLVLGWSGQARAQEPSGRIELDVVSASPVVRLVTFRVGFVENDRDCPVDLPQKLRIWNATLVRIDAHLPTDPRPASPWHATMLQSGDETQVYRIWTSTCRTEVAVRQQVHDGASWVNLLVPKRMRPSVPSEERQELGHQFLEDLRAQLQTPEARERVDRFGAADKALHLAGSLRLIGGVTVWPFPFDDQPQTCFEAVGDFRIERTGVMFSFMAGLPGDLNRFTIERSDPDANQGRIFFTRGDCRFELTISQSVLQGNEWLAVPLAPVPVPTTKG
jgi:hypothetical protein